MSEITFGTLEELDKLIAGRKHSIIADENIIPHINREVIPFSAKEENKSLESIQKLASALSAQGLDRHSVLVAVGGGITSDTVGFLASIYMRGIPWISVPTTLLAMADSCAGGKTAVNTKEGKNLLGSFHEPEAILIDTNFLNSLSEVDFISGLAEIIKMGLILDENLIEYLENYREEILKREAITMQRIIEWALKLKMEIVDKDPKEQNIRKLLNFGHTFGHAIESDSNFQIPHGHAVALGIQLMNEYSKNPEDMQVRCKKLFEGFGLPTNISQDKKLLRKKAFSDKKRQGDSIDLVVLEKIGKAKILRDSKFLQ